jgi:hypothetical protein
VALRVRTTTLLDLKRSRGKFQVEITAEELIEVVVALHLDSPDDVLLEALRQHFEELYIDWLPRYATDAMQMRTRLKKQRSIRLFEETYERTKRSLAEYHKRNDWRRRRNSKKRGLQ